MGSFASFIESEAFFPILIILLMLLMFMFVSILMSGRNQEKKKMQERKKIQIDENAQIQLVQHGGSSVHREKVTEEKEIGGTEVGLVKEIQAAELSEVEEELDAMRITIEDNADDEVKVPNYNRPVEDMEDEYIIERQNTLEEELNESEIVKVELTEPTEYSSDSGEEITISKKKMEDESGEIPIIADEEKENIHERDAFEMNANDDHTINEHVEADVPKEYEGDKTEILDFPDFDFLDDEKTQKIETRIINQANKYIESVMESRENNEE